MPPLDPRMLDIGQIVGIYGVRYILPNAEIHVLTAGINRYHYCNIHELLIQTTS